MGITTQRCDCELYRATIVPIWIQDNGTYVPERYYEVAVLRSVAGLAEEPYLTFVDNHAAIDRHECVFTIVSDVFFGHLRPLLFDALAGEALYPVGRNTL
ncbi:hypothetical protein MTX35_23180 [Rhodococcus sp. ARC_M12]|uniref:hypothetical protein n=1 Tax=Rhodococcus sp. ARC_M12 TaxID=2928854 RepID=UPI001FB2BB9D|nr:hypothetical protein [Rhodococcus sp. ARC_M12]MCJ0980614.1 hypothetical protein [Rhodococcus sp. ARC_M12]